MLPSIGVVAISFGEQHPEFESQVLFFNFLLIFNFFFTSYHLKSMINTSTFPSPQYLPLVCSIQVLSRKAFMDFFRTTHKPMNIIPVIYTAITKLSIKDTLFHLFGPYKKSVLYILKNFKRAVVYQIPIQFNAQSRLIR